MKRNQRGQALVIFALSAVVLFGLASIAVDQGLAMADRRNLQAAADAASLAGTRQYSQAVDQGQAPAAALNQSHYVALQYLVAALGGAIPGSCPSSSSCPAGPYTLVGTTFTFTLTDSPNGVLDVSGQHVMPLALAGAIGLGPTTVGTGARARPVNPLTIGAGFNVAALSAQYQVNGAGTCNPSGNVTGNVYSQGTFGTNNSGSGCHSTQVPDQLTGVDNSGNLVTCPGGGHTQVAFGGNLTVNTGNWNWVNEPAINHPGNPLSDPNVKYNQPQPTAFDNDPPRPPQNKYANTAAGHLAAQDANGNFKPGTYDGWVPTPSVATPGKLTGGVYLLQNLGAKLQNPLDISGVSQYYTAGLDPNTTPKATAGGPDGGTTLSTALTSGTLYSSLHVGSLSGWLPAVGTSIIIAEEPPPAPPAVRHIQTVTIAAGSIGNTLNVSPFTANFSYGVGSSVGEGSDAVAIVVDNTDSGSFTISSKNGPVLNGYEGDIDAVGTHNFDVYGGPSGASGFNGTIAQLQPTDSFAYEGIFYLPNNTLVSKGDTNYVFFGAVYMHDYVLDGGGNAGQGFTFICGLTSIAGLPINGGLIR